MAARWVALRAAVGLAAGWVIVANTAPSGVPGWWAPAVAGTLGVAVAVAPGTDRWAGTGINSGWALASGVGLYVGVPETDRLVGMLPVLAIIWLAELSGRMRVDAAVVIALDTVLVWAAVHGAVNRAGALVAALAGLGLLVVAPLVDLVAGRVRGTARLAVPGPWRMPLLVGLQFLYAVGVARVGGIRTTTAEAVAVVAVAVPLLALIAAPIIGRPADAERVSHP